MKRLYSTACLLLLAHLTFGQTVLLTENFNYTAGDSLRSNGWTSHSGGTTNALRVTAPGLSWTQTPYRANNVGNAAGVNNTGADENRNFSSYPNSGSVYISFMAKVNVPTTNLFFLHTGQYSNTASPDFSAVSTSFRGRVFAVPGSTASKFRFGLTFNSSTVTGVVGTDVTQDLDTSKTYLVVLKYRIVAGASNDSVSLFVFEDGDNIALEPATPTLGPVTFTGATVPDADTLQYVALRQAAASQRVTVDGIVAQTSWDMLSTNTWNGTTWSAGQAPNKENAVIDGNLTLSSSITAGNVSINSGFNLTLASGNDLIVQGNLTNNGQLQMGADSVTITGSYSGTGNVRTNGGSLIVQGNGALGTLNFDQTTDGTTNVLANLTLNRASTGSMTIGNKLNLSGLLTLTAGTLNTGGNLHLKSSSATATAQVIGGTNSSINGNVTVERFLPWQSSNNNGFRFVSHPLQSAPVINTVNNLPTTTHTLIKYDEASSSYQGLNDRSVTWPQGAGYGIWTTAVNTISFIGALQLSGVGNISLTNSGSRYSMIGNPFPSVVDWDAVTRTNMENSVWTWVKDNSAVGSGAWASYVNGVSANGGTRYIAPMQGFIVRAEASGTPGVEFTASARVSGQSPAFNRTNSLGDILRVRLDRIDNGNTMETVLRFHDMGTPSFDGNFDAGFLSDFVNSSPDLYTMDGANNKYSINSLPLIGNDVVTIPLHAETFGAGNFKLKFDASQMTLSNIQLEDTKLGTFTALADGQQINFVAANNDAVDRFRLHFNRLAASVTTNELDRVQVYSHEGQIYVKGIEQAEQLRILDISGRVVFQLNAPQFDGNPIQPHLNAGTYLVQLIGENGAKTVKLIF